MGYFQVKYNSRVVIYEHKMFIRLATEEGGVDRWRKAIRSRRILQCDQML